MKPRLIDVNHSLGLGKASLAGFITADAQSLIITLVTAAVVIAIIVIANIVIDGLRHALVSVIGQRNSHCTCEMERLVRDLFETYRRLGTPLGLSLSTYCLADLII